MVLRNETNTIYIKGVRRMNIIDNLRAQGVDEKLIEDVMYFRNYYGLEKI